MSMFVSKALKGHSRNGETAVREPGPLSMSMFANSADYWKAMFEAQRASCQRLVDAADALVCNEEHAESGGMRTYQKGSPTWHLWKDLRAAIATAAGTKP